MGSESSGDRSPSAAMAAAATASCFGQGSGSLRRCRLRSHRRRRYRVPRAPARLAPSSPRNQWPTPPDSVPQARDRLSPPRPCCYSWPQINSWSCQGSSFFPIGERRGNVNCHMTSRRPLGLQKLHVTRGSASHWKRGHRVTSRPGGGARRLQRAGHVFQEAARPLLRAHSGRGIIAPYWPKDATKRHLLFAVTVGLPLAGLSGPVTRGMQLYWPELRSRSRGRG